MLWLIPLIILLAVVLVCVMSYFADPAYWKRRVQQGGTSWQDLQDDIKHFEEKEPWNGQW